MLKFGKFIESMNIVDVPLFGGKFIWFEQDGRLISKLDRF